jgi:hypothetical protein
MEDLALAMTHETSTISADVLSVYLFEKNISKVNKKF